MVLKTLMYKNSYDENLNSILSALTCLKCGSNHNMVPYPINEIKKFVILGKINKSKISSTLFVPLCFRCSTEFDRWKRYKANLKRARIRYSILLILISLSIYFLTDNLWLFFSAELCLLIMLLTNYFKATKYVDQMEYHPRNYMYFKDYDRFYVKPENSDKWLEFIDWIRETLYNQIYIKECKDISFMKINKEDFIKCEYCGAKVSKNDVSCIKCTRLLPLN